MIDLDAAESLAREMADSPWLTVEDLDDLREVARSALALVAEVRRLWAGSMGPGWVQLPPGTPWCGDLPGEPL